MHTPEYVMSMTDAEYKVWVEQGDFPARLEEAREKEQKDRRDKRKAAKAKREQKTTKTQEN